MARSGGRGARGGGSRKTKRGGRHVMVVESPVKARTIGGYLGREYRVIATRGHVRDLPAKAGSVKPEDGFAMVTETGKRAARTLGAVAKALAKAETLVLATDPDREGEAIAWQVLEWLTERDAVGDVPVHRVAFHEVTPAAVRTALSRPRDIDMDLVRAWQARRALDYLVGYGLSPLLWRKLPGCRSAGRVQSVALRLLCEREAEIEAFQPRQYRTVHAELAAADGVPFPATLCRLDGSAVGEEGLAMEELAQETAKRIGESRLAVRSAERDTLRRRPLPPFTTATLQQEALQRLASAFRPGDTLTASYAKPGSNPIKDAANNEAVSLAETTVTNNLAATAPEAPGNLAAASEAVPGTPSQVYADRMVLSWDTPWNNGDAITSYKVRYVEGSSAGGTLAAIAGSGASTTSHTVTGLEPGTEYTFGIVAVNGQGDGDEATVTMTTPAPAWSFTLRDSANNNVTELTEGGDAATATVSITNNVRFSTEQTVTIQFWGSKPGRELR